MITLVLTPEQAAKLEDVLLNAQDEGPAPEGWASAEVEELRALVHAAITRWRP